MLLCYLLLFFTFGYTTAKERKTILQYTPENEVAFDTIGNIEKVLDFEPDFLHQSRSLGNPGSILLQDSSFVDKVVKYLNRTEVKHKIFEYSQPDRKEVHKILNEDNISSLLANHYLSYDQQIRYIDQLCTKYNNFVKAENIGNTFEGRNITAVKFGFPGNNKPILWVNAGIHAREWIGHSTAFYFINQLSTNPEWLEILKKIDIVVTPNANPDGYEYTRTIDRLWRTNRLFPIQPKQRPNKQLELADSFWEKNIWETLLATDKVFVTTINRIKSGSTTCYGIDINRNFPYKWKPFEAETSNICEAKRQLVYSGPGSNSEKETQALTGGMERVKDRIKGFVDLHSQGEQILYPWGYLAAIDAPSVKELIDVANKMKTAIQQERGTNYTVINMAKLKPITGLSIDYAKSLGIKYTYIFEMSGVADPDTRWVTPEIMIEPVAKEIINALKVLAKQIVKEFVI